MWIEIEHYQLTNDGINTDEVNQSLVNIEKMIYVVLSRQVVFGLGRKLQNFLEIRLTDTSVFYTHPNLYEKLKDILDLECSIEMDSNENQLRRKT